MNLVQKYWHLKVEVAFCQKENSVFINSPMYVQLQVCVSISVGISGFTDRGREEGIQVGGKGSLAIIQYEAHTDSLIPGIRIKDQGSESIVTI